MAEVTCKACRANPPACANLCLPCWKDQIEADREKRHAEERRRGRERREARKPGSGWDRSLLKRVLRP